MRPFDHLIPSDDEKCQRELARILATGLLRLRGHVPIPAEVATSDNSRNSSADCLELSAATSVTGPDGLTVPENQRLGGTTP